MSSLRQTYPAVRSLRDVTMEMLEVQRDALGDVLCRRARHVVEENQRVREGVGFLRRKDAACFARLMVASHRSLRDFYQVSCPELDQLVELMPTLPGTAGAALPGPVSGDSWWGWWRWRRCLGCWDCSRSATTPPGASRTWLAGCWCAAR
ncbi:MAG: hypothetical protein H5U04_04645 [Firmicutes bacterium]|nr:hypothetical protein [Bacillota bacterium]